MTDLERRLEDHAKMKVRVQDLGAFLKSGKCKRFFDAAAAMTGPGLYSYSWLSTSAVSLFVNVSELEGFKDPRLAGIIESFDYMNPTDTRTRDDAASFERRVTMTWPFIEVCVVGRIKEESKTCKRLITKVTHHEPTVEYKFVCDDEAHPTDAEVVASAHAAVDAGQEFPVNQLADVSADLDELTRERVKPEPVAPVPAPDLGDWESK